MCTLYRRNENKKLMKKVIYHLSFFFFLLLRHHASSHFRAHIYSTKSIPLFVFYECKMKLKTFVYSITRRQACNGNFLVKSSDVDIEEKTNFIVCHHSFNHNVLSLVFNHIHINYMYVRFLWVSFSSSSSRAHVHVLAPQICSKCEFYSVVVLDKKKIRNFFIPYHSLFYERNLCFLLNIWW